MNNRIPPLHLPPTILLKDENLGLQTEKKPNLFNHVIVKTWETVSSLLLSKKEEKEESLPSFNGTREEQKKEFEVLFQKNEKSFQNIISKIEKVTEYSYYEKDDTFPYSFIHNMGRSFIFLKTRSRKNPKIKYPAVGKGSSCRATLCYDVDTKEYHICRSGERKSIKTHEIELNKCLKSYDKYFVVGEFYSYTKNKQPHIWKRGEKMAMITPYFENGDLSQAIEKGTFSSLSPLQKIAFIRHIAEGLDILHSVLKMAWSDLKPANIFLTKDFEPRLADFGTACEIGRSREIGCTPMYRSPEDKVTDKRDIWSLGAVLVDLFYEPGAWLQQIFKNTKFSVELFGVLYDPKTLVERIDELVPEESRSNPEHIDSLIYKCLQYNPEDRPSAKQFLELLKDIKI